MVERQQVRPVALGSTGPTERLLRAGNASNNAVQRPRFARR